ncbi:MFS transporter [Actinoplanes sp. NPDC048796]|uniref:MFS transporter n=1 Tax=Actinoplanes sp. NPDC048796 TaxID=3155640 RepID=UPI0033C4491F
MGQAYDRDRPPEESATQDRATQDRATQDRATQDRATQDRATQDRATQGRATQDQETAGQVRDRERPSRERATRGGVMVGQVREGLRFVLGDPVLRAIAATSGLSNVLFVAANALNVYFLVETVGVSAATAGLLFSTASVAALVAAAVATRLARWLGPARIIWLSVTVTSPFNLLIPFTDKGWRLSFFVVGICVGGAGQLVYAITQLSYRQAVVPRPILGRVNATMRFLVMGLLPLGGLLGGALATLSSVRLTLSAVAVGLTLAPIFLILSPLRRQPLRP